MHAIASGNLAGLHLFGADSVSGAFDLHNDAGWTGLETSDNRHANKPFVASQPYFDAFSVLQYVQDRSQAAVDEIQISDRLVHFIQDGVNRQLNELCFSDQSIRNAPRKTQ